MLDSLYTEALKKKGSINNMIEEFIDENIDIESVWRQEKTPPSDEKLVLAAGDGSFNKKKFLTFNLYAVAAEALIYNPDSKLKTIESVELDILPHQTFIDERLRNMMSIFEIRTAIKALKSEDIDYYMDDGSILGDLIRPIPIEKSITLEAKRKIANRIYQNINAETEISSFNFRQEFGELFEDVDDENSMLTYLETIEHLVGLKNLLFYNKKIIAISKSSTSNDLFHSNVPDMAILDTVTRKEGYSKPIYRKVDSEVKREFPVFNEFFTDLWFTTFFVRLEDNKNILKVEIPYYLEEGQIKKIIAIIKSNATDGYPFLLKRAHHDVVIKHKDINNLSNIIEILDRTGREML